jgi:hypothetical protein
MAINFGLASLVGYRNAWETGCACTTSPANTGCAVATGMVWLDGIKCQLTATTITFGVTNSGTGKWIIAVLPAGNTSTADATAVFADPTGLVYALLDRFSYGTAAGKIEMLTGAGGNTAKTALVTFGRAQNVTVNITYDQAQARGGNLVFGNDAKFFNGAIEGNAEFVEMNVENLSQLLGGSYASGGNTSGTWTVSATNKPLPFMLRAKVLTDGVTGEVTMLKCFSTQLALPIDRENYVVQNFNFVAVANAVGNILQVQE